MNNIPDSEDKRECIRSLHKTRKHLNTMTKKKKKFCKPTWNLPNITQMCPRGYRKNETSAIQICANVSDIDSPIIFKMT